MRLTWLAPLLLAGCAAAPPMDEASVRARAPYISTFQLCGAIMYGSPMHAQIAREETARRGENCANYRDAIVQEQARRQAASAAADAQAMEMARQFLAPPVAPLPSPRTCTTRAVGNTLQTQCY